MIWQPFIDFVITMLTGIIDSIEFNVSLPDNIFSAFHTVFGALGYFFPIKALLPILVISGILSLLRISIVIIRFIKGFIPTMGG